MTSSGLTVAPVARTSPEPQGAGSRGAVPHSCHPHPGVLSPHRPPPRAHSLFLVASPFSEERHPLSFQRPAPVIPGSCPFRATLPSLLVSSRPPEVSFHNFPEQHRSSQSLRRPPGSPGLGAIGTEGRPHPSPPSPVSRAEARQDGVRLRRGAGRGLPQAAGSLLADGRESGAELLVKDPVRAHSLRRDDGTPDSPSLSTPPQLRKPLNYSRSSQSPPSPCLALTLRPA